jgi:hypothetical protein
MSEKEIKNKEKTKQVTFSKRRILEMPEFKNRNDALNVLLDDNKSYNENEVRKILNEFFVKV